jgi:hypothetical protein
MHNGHLPFSEMCSFVTDNETCRSIYNMRTAFLVMHFDQDSDTTRNIGLLVLIRMPAREFL